jgi:hypothetical protein
LEAPPATAVVVAETVSAIADPAALALPTIAFTMSPNMLMGPTPCWKQRGMPKETPNGTMQSHNFDLATSECTFADGVTSSHPPYSATVHVMPEAAPFPSQLR